MILSFLLSIHAVEFAFGAVILWRAHGFLRVEGVFYAVLVVMHLLLHHQIPNGALDRFFDFAILSFGAILMMQILWFRKRVFVRVKE